MKILVLHGYTQSGSGFQKKIKKLESHLQGTFSDASFHFPTAPIQLRLSEMVAVTLQQKADDDPGQQVQHGKPGLDDIDCYAWFRLNDHLDPPEGLIRSLEMLAKCLREHGPFDGVLGFSQGGLMAIMVASLLEGNARREAFARAEQESAEALPFPASFKDMQHPPFKFGITYGALMGVAKIYAPFYENPRIQTPFCQFSGLWDPVVSVEMVEAVDRAQIGGKRSLKVVHPGAHAVCTERGYLDTVVDFIKGVESYSMSQERGARQLVVEKPIIQTIEWHPSEAMGKGIDISMKELCLSSTSSVSDESCVDSKSAKRRRGRSKMNSMRKSSWNRVRTARFPLHFHERRRIDDSRSDSTSIDLSWKDKESNTRNLHDQRLWLNDALEIFLNEWIQIEVLHGYPPSRVIAQEMAARILRMNIVRNSFDVI